MIWLTTALAYYFAYGSNMLPSVMSALRKIEPINATAAVLQDYRLCFDVPGLPLVEPSAASVRPAKGRLVHGVLYTLTDEDFEQVSRTEGVPWAYQWEDCCVIPYVGNAQRAGEQTLESGAAKPRRARTLVTTKRIDIPPSRSYVEILRKGAAYWNLDREYQVALAQVTTVPVEGTSGLLLRLAELSLVGMRTKEPLG